MNKKVYGIRKITTKEFQTALNHIHKPPPFLFVRGEEKLLSDSRPAICIVGTRTPTEYGQKVTRQIISYLAPFSPIIISGLATGIDSVALSEAANQGLDCIAVLGCGLDDESIYPRTNIKLAHIILEHGGLLTSEYPPGQNATKWSFPERNRIMAGLAKIVIIVEGKTTSGTMITARLALEYNRDVFAVPGPIFSETSQGPLSLIEQGAMVLKHPSDILSHLGLVIPTQLILRDEIERENAYKRCGEKELKVLQILKTVDQGFTIDELLKETHMNIAELQLVITMLEVKKLISEKLGKIVPL
jgi:DNA processing protein